MKGEKAGILERTKLFAFRISRPDADIVKAERPSDLIKETDELTAILVTSVKTLKARRHK